LTVPNIIEINGVSRHFGPVRALDGVDMKIREGEFFSLLGPSGCGKTTLLRMIAGFDDPTAGEVMIAGEAMTGVPANLRPTNMVFQNYAIFPHLNVGKNVAYGLRKMRLAPDELKSRVSSALEMVDLAGLEDRGAEELSGGQRQRVALARALIMRPKVLLLDEPLSALDKKLREQMQIELRRLQRSVGITFILVTHDQHEALTMSDRIAVMFNGKVDQVASPGELYERPASRDVAGFIGGMNFVDAAVKKQTAKQITVQAAGLGTVVVANGGNVSDDASDIVLGIRPERLSISRGNRAGKNQIAGTISDAAFFGEVTHYYVDLPGRQEPLAVSVSNSAEHETLPAGARVTIGFDPKSLVPLD